MTEKIWDVFISYKRDPDEEAALDLLGALERAGLNCWIAPRDIRTTDQMIAARQLTTDGGWDTVIPFAIRGSRAMAVVLSDAAMKDGKQIKKELYIGDKADIKFFPVLIEDAPLRDSFELHLGREQWSNCFSGKGSQRFLNVATDICGFLGVAMRDKPAPSTKSIAPPSVGDDGRSCPDCGGKSPAEAKFCNGCGISFAVEISAKSGAPVAAESIGPNTMLLCVPNQFDEILRRAREYIPSISHQAKSEYITIHVGNDRDKTLRLKPKTDGFSLEWTTSRSDEWEHRLRTIGIGIEYKTSINKGAYVIKVKGVVSQSTAQLLVEFLRSVFGRHVDGR